MEKNMRESLIGGLVEVILFIANPAGRKVFQEEEMHYHRQQIPRMKITDKQREEIIARWTKEGEKS